VHLNERDRTEAGRLVERLDGIRVDAIYSSPLERCRETAAPLAKARRLSVHVRRSLIETGYGEWTGPVDRAGAEDEALANGGTGPLGDALPRGESLLEVQARAVDEVNRIAQDHPRGVVVVYRMRTRSVW
jgi:probable phosphoglycerate mutase